MHVVDMALHGKYRDTKLLAFKNRQLLEPSFNTRHPEYLSSVLRAKDKVIVDERYARGSTYVFVFHKPIITL